jgi:toxin HigB-1
MILYDAVVIKSWANRATQRFAEEDKSRFTGLDEALARRRLRLLDEAERLQDLTGLKSVGLHRLRGARKAQWAISAGGPWRITFEFRDGHAWNVEIIDYH